MKGHKNPVHRQQQHAQKKQGRAAHPRPEQGTPERQPPGAELPPDRDQGAHRHSQQQIQGGQSSSQPAAE